MNLKRLTAAPTLAIALAACGAQPPQAPPKEAMKLGVATGAISAKCGLAYQATAFPGGHARDLRALEAAVSPYVEKLASVYARNPGWIYQGKTIHEIVDDAISMLSSCGLTDAARKLGRARPSAAVDPAAS